MDNDEVIKLLIKTSLPEDEAIKISSDNEPRYIEVTTLSDREPRFIELIDGLTIHCNAPVGYDAPTVLKTKQLCYIATCVIVRHLKAHTSYNCCVYCKLPFDSINKIKGLQQLIDCEEITHITDKCGVIHIRCFNSFDVYQESIDKMFREINRWFSMKSSSEEIKYMEIIT